MNEEDPDQYSRDVGWCSGDVTGGEQATNQGQKEMVAVNGILLRTVRHRQNMLDDDSKYRHVVDVDHNGLTI